MLAVFIYQQSSTCAAVSREPCQHGGESLHYRARDCILQRLTYTHRHIQYPCCFSSERAPLTITLCLTSNCNIHSYVSNLKRGSSQPSGIKITVFLMTPGKHLVNQLHKQLLFWVVSIPVRTPQGRENTCVHERTDTRQDSMEGCH